MQLRTALFSLAGLAAAAIEDGTPFNLMALRSASDIHFAPFNAALNSILLRLPSQNANCGCGVPSNSSAAFYLEEGGLYLYTGDDSTPQQLFVDRSGMGESWPRNGERDVFELDEYDDLTFNGSGFLACPGSIDDAWSVWVSAGVANPGGHTDCLGLVARAVENDDAAPCLYTN
ncbi:unnamed protein product [Parascedosporium putredinis]|uniref:Cell wall protein PhiA n=1 Tax=Parascedosporium putredinis TaxID=1442378 RepID=A0A9P1H2Q9_9PEZI|nr:unnamed protein product [Parascedosporium putredinis]CAI7993806.1 unnamed protein product [Parascedosporium putredinis]